MANLVGQSDVSAYTTATGADGLSGARAHAIPFVASNSGNATTLYHYITTYNGQNRKLFITDALGNVLAVTAAVTEAEGWVSGAIPSTSITSGNTYYLGWYIAAGYSWYYTNSVYGSVYIDDTSGTYTSPPSAFTSPSNDGSIPAFAMYADGTAIYTRTLSDSLATNDAPVRGVKAFRQMPQDAVAMLESLIRSQRHGRTTSDVASVSDAAQRVALLFHGLSDSVAVGDGLLRFAQLFRKLLDSAAATDTLIVTLTLSGVTIVTRILQDGLNVADTVQRAVSMYRLESQVLDVHDGSWYSASIVRGVTDILTVAESTARVLLLTRTVTDPVAAADAAFRFALLSRTLHDDADASDSLAKTITYYESLIGFVLMSLHNDPVILALDNSAAEISLARALDDSTAEISLVRTQPILMEMRNL